MRRGWLFLTLSLLLVGCDHGTKLAAARLLPGQPVSLVSGWLELRYAENRDIAFSALSALHLPASRALLLVFGVLAMFAIAVAWARTRARSLPSDAGFALVLAGAAGNLLDRAFRGYVVDFVHLTHWPVFNVADVLIVVGAIVLAASNLRGPTRRSERPAG